MIIEQNIASDNTLRQASLVPFQSMGELVPLPMSSGGTSTPDTFYDSAGNNLTDSTVWTDYQVVEGDSVTVENLNPEVAALADGRLSRVADGVGTVEFVKGSIKKPVRYASTATGGASTFVFTDYTPGTVAAHFGDQVKALINSDLSKRDLEYFSTINHATATFVKNPDCWARDVDMSALAIGSEIGIDSGNWTTERAGTLITPRHVLLNWHYKPALGEKFRFLTPAMELREAAIAGFSSSGSGWGGVDQSVLTLSEDIIGCNPMKVGDTWVTQRVTDDSYYAGGLVIGLDKHRRMGLFLLGHPTLILSDRTWAVDYQGINVAGNDEVVVYGDGTAESLHPYIASNSDLTFQPVLGDSSSPVVAIVDGDPVVLATWRSSISGPCTWMGDGAHEMLTQLILEADADAGVSTGYAVTAAVDPT